MLEHPPFVPESKEYIADLVMHHPFLYLPLSQTLNQVIICTHSSPTLEFRSPTKKDYHGSALAENVFDSLEERKIDQKFLLGKLGMAMGNDGWSLTGSVDSAVTIIRDGNGEKVLQAWVKNMAEDYWLGEQPFYFW